MLATVKPFCSKNALSSGSGMTLLLTCPLSPIRLTLQPDFLPNDWYGYRGQVKRIDLRCIAWLKVADYGHEALDG